MNRFVDRLKNEYLCNSIMNLMDNISMSSEGTSPIVDKSVEDLILETIEFDIEDVVFEIESRYHF